MVLLSCLFFSLPSSMSFINCGLLDATGGVAAGAEVVAAAGGGAASVATASSAAIFVTSSVFTGASSTTSGVLPAGVSTGVFTTAAGASCILTGTWSSSILLPACK